ncbi:MAG: oligosaccharide flippase family protein [Clostridia bacterium]|nr:oligosaccharide flippase family protein [Clostridia bacterium]
MSRLKKFVVSGLIVTVVSLLVRAISVSFNVYLSNKIGAVAMGIFTLISTVYGFAVTVATSGIGLATTKIVAEVSDEQGKKTPAVRCTVKKCIVYALCFSLGATIILFFFAPMIGTKILHDNRTVKPLQAMAMTLVPLALSSVLSGYFIAVRRVYKNASVVILGQAVRIFGCIFFFSILGAKDVESACLSIALGAVASEGISLLLQAALYFMEKGVQTREKISTCEGRAMRKTLLSTAIPVALSAYVRSALVTIEHLLIPWGLERSGASRERSLAAYGIVHSMVFPLVLFPAAISGSFAGLLVPEIAQAKAMEDTTRIERIVERVFSSVLMFAIGTAGILLCFSRELSDVIYPEVGAGKFILMIAPLVPVMYLDTSVDSILKGLGEQIYCMGVNIADAMLSVILVWMLLPALGITGYIVTVYFTEIVNATLSIARLLSVTKIKPHPIRWIAKPLFCIVASTASVRCLISLAKISVRSPISLTVQITLALSIYLFLLVVTNSLLIFKKEKKKRLI